MQHRKKSSIIIGVFLFLVYIGYYTKYLTNIPCDSTLVSKFCSNFVHIDSIHLILNLLGLFIISNLEKEIGTKKFISVVISISVLLSILETFLHQKCSIGFSGVLYGLFAYEMMYNKYVDYDLLLTLILMFLFSTDTKISHTGHALGFFAGFLVSLII